MNGHAIVDVSMMYTVGDHRGILRYSTSRNVQNSYATTTYAWIVVYKFM